MYLFYANCNFSICLSYSSASVSSNVPNNTLPVRDYKMLFFHSERSDECIDFTMIITSRNNAPISNFKGGFRCKSEYPWCIIEVKS
ncbi:Uncharacterized protein FWK35_00021795 [Aphis craccivora]|uniref:Uncharacterized protein n=1 Tax=Aphis craccivora TaxID=307492 RepID=A0A6G0XX62_APHCR|nr:Uncharacterized protein FWK35_00021795 [Aphis craccivora]